MENCLSCVESDRGRAQRGQDAWRARRGGRESCAAWLYSVSAEVSTLLPRGRRSWRSWGAPSSRAPPWEVFLSAKAPPQDDGSN